SSSGSCGTPSTELVSSWGVCVMVRGYVCPHAGRGTHRPAAGRRGADPRAEYRKGVRTMRQGQGRGPLYRLYSSRLRRQITAGSVPEHVAMVIDGNRRWARQLGYDSVAHGYRAGAAKIIEFLGWCDELGVKHVTLYLLSNDNLRK